MKMRIDEVNELIQESEKKLHNILQKIYSTGSDSAFWTKEAFVKEHDEELKRYSELQVEKAMLEKGVL